jgi:hypothetical protein
MLMCTNEKTTIACRAGSLLRFEYEKSGVGEVPTVRASVGCGCVEFWSLKAAAILFIFIAPSTQLIFPQSGPFPSYQSKNSHIW